MKLTTLLMSLFVLARSVSQTIPDSTTQAQPDDTTFILKFNPKIGDLKTNLRIASNEDPPYSSTIYICFSRTNSDSLFQNLSCYVPPTMLLNWEFTDVNFDGYPDFVITHDAGGAYPNDSYIVYLFDVKRSKFRHSEEFSILSGDLSFSPSDKHITSAFRFNCPECTTTATYLVRGNHLILIEKSSEDKDWNTGEIFTTVERLIKGEMVTIRKH